jgi:hypothetical protein
MRVREEAVRLVEEDVKAVFGEAFPGRFGVPQPFGELVPIVGNGVTVVPWTWRGTHTGDFREVRRTGLPVEFAGTTLLTETDGGVRFHRIVDWLTLYRQLGLMMVCRRPRTESTEDVDDSDVAVLQSTETAQRA